MAPAPRRSTWTAPRDQRCDHYHCAWPLRCAHQPSRVALLDVVCIPGSYRCARNGQLVRRSLYRREVQPHRVPHDRKARAGRRAAAYASPIDFDAVTASGKKKSLYFVVLESCIYTLVYVVYRKEFYTWWSHDTIRATGEARFLRSRRPHHRRSHTTPRKEFYDTAPTEKNSKRI